MFPINEDSNISEEFRNDSRIHEHDFISVGRFVNMKKQLHNGIKTTYEVDICIYIHFLAVQ